MKRLIFITVIFSLLGKVMAQADDARDTTYNELGISVGPIILVMLGSQPYSQPVALTYRRVIDRELAARVSVGGYFGPGIFTEKGFGELKKLNDSMATREFFYQKQNTKFARLGMEYRFSVHRAVQLVIGSDLQGRVISAEEIVDEVTALPSELESMSPTFQNSFPSGSSTERKFTRKITSTQIGIGITPGLNVFLGRRWVVYGNMRINIYTGRHEQSSTNVKTGEVINQTSNTTDVDFGTTLAEVSLFYRF